MALGEEKEFQLIMLHMVGRDKIKTIKLVRELTGVGLAEAKDMVENLPCQILGGLTDENAQKVAEVINSLGNRAITMRDFSSMEETPLPKIDWASYGMGSGMSGMSSLESNLSGGDDTNELVRPVELEVTHTGTDYHGDYTAYGTNGINGTNGNSRDGLDSRTTQANSPVQENRFTHGNSENQDLSGGRPTPKATNPSGPNSSTRQSYKPLPKEKEKPSPWQKLRIALGIYFGSFFLAGIVLIIVFYAISQSGNNKPNTQVPPATTYVPTDVYDYGTAQEMMNQLMQNAQANADSVDTDALLAKMEEYVTFRYLAKEVFGKEVKKLKSSDLEQITYFKMVREERQDHHTLYYGLNGGDPVPLSVPDETIPFSVMALFPNLMYLDCNYFSYNGKDVVTLPYLQHLGLRTEMITDVSRLIIAPGLVSVRVYTGLTGSAFDFSRFPYLTSVELDTHSGENLSALTEIPNLKYLKVTCESSSNFDLASLVGLTDLESFYICSKAVKDLTFLQKFTNLKSLGVEGTEVITYEPIAELAGQLEELYLLDNYKVEDSEYDFISGLTGLKKLSLNPHLENDYYLDLTGLTQLEELMLGNIHHLDSLVALSELKRLELYSPYDHQFDFLLGMPKLEELHIHNGSLYNRETEMIARQEQITHLCLADTYIWNEASHIFNMPNLETLELQDATLALRPDWVEHGNMTLHYLDLYRTRFMSLDEDGAWYYDNYAIDLSEVEDLFYCFFELRELFIPDNQMNNLTALSSRKSLRVLDISGTYITNLTPITENPLSYVDCHNCQIYDYAGLEDICIK